MPWVSDGILTGGGRDVQVVHLGVRGRVVRAGIGLQRHAESGGGLCCVTVMI